MIGMRAFLLLAVPLVGFQSSGGVLVTPGSSTQPVCVQKHLLRQVEAGTPSTLAWQEQGGPGGRRVTVLFDTEGAPLQYSEMETTEAVESFNRNGQYRLVFVNLESGFSVVEIQAFPGERLQEQREMEDVLRSAELGSPAEMIRLVRAECTSF